MLINTLKEVEKLSPENELENLACQISTLHKILQNTDFLTVYGKIRKIHIMANFKQCYTDYVKKDTKVVEHLPLEKAGIFVIAVESR